MSTRLRRQIRATKRLAAKLARLEASTGIRFVFRSIELGTLKREAGK